jgi:hypothetical protein
MGSAGAQRSPPRVLSGRPTHREPEISRREPTVHAGRRTRVVPQEPTDRRVRWRPGSRQHLERPTSAPPRSRSRARSMVLPVAAQCGHGVGVTPPGVTGQSLDCHRAVLRGKERSLQSCSVVARSTSPEPRSHPQCAELVTRAVPVPWRVRLEVEALPRVGDRCLPRWLGHGTFLWPNAPKSPCK